MNKFEPSKTYDGLLEQAKALYTLASSQERRITMLNASMEKLTRDYNAIGQDAINAERDINQQLTNYVEVLEKQISELKEGIVRCRHQASYSIGDDEALKNQLAKVRDIANEVLGACR